MKQKKPLVLQYIAPDQLNPWDKNPRRISDQGLKKLEKSFKDFGFITPILAQEGTNLVIAGHQRLKAALAAKLKKVPVVFLDLNDKEAAAYNMADNRLAQESTWENDLLANLLSNLKESGLDLSMTGLEDFELETVMAGLVDYDAFYKPGTDGPKKENPMRMHTCPDCGFEFEE